MELAVSYLFLRRAIGLIGALLPVVLPLGYALSTGHWRLLASMSSYYYSDMRNVFVGSLCAVGVFLICYRYRHWDDVFATIGARARSASRCVRPGRAVPRGWLRRWVCCTSCSPRCSW